MISNKYNFPSSIVRAVERDPYDAGNSDISVTRLISPPQQVQLRREAAEKGLTQDEDVSDRIWSLLGQASHTILERAAGKDAVVEQRWFVDVMGWVLSGQIDLMEDGVLTDFKVTSVWSVKDTLANGNKKYEEQLNVLKWLYDGQPDVPEDDSIHSLQIVAICRDWRKNEAMRYDDYPKQSEVIEVPMWTDNERQMFVEKKIFEHQEARAGNYRPCTDEERWMKPSTYAVMKEGRKSALRVLDSQQEAETWIKETSPKGVISITHRPGEYTMCESYCDVAPFCSQKNDEP